MIDPTKDDIGRLVIYQVGTEFQEEGIVTSFNNFYVFVRFKGENHSKATLRYDLTWSI